MFSSVLLLFVKTPNFRIAFFLFVALLGLVGLECAHKADSESGIPRRIVSLAPGITETLFALGLGDRVIGVTTYCRFPQKADSIEKIGGYADANPEKIISLHPDLVVLLPEHEKQRIYLERFRVRTLTINNSTCAQVCSSFAVIGRSCGVIRAADSLIEVFAGKLGKAPASAGYRPKVLFCIGRDSPGAGTIKTVYAAGRKTFYNDLVVAAGGENAFPDSLPLYPRLSPEGILALSPDVIIDAASVMGSCSCDLLARDWRGMTRIPAIKNGRVYCLSKDYATVPGPRLALLLDDLRGFLGSQERPYR